MNTLKLLKNTLVKRVIFLFKLSKFKKEVLFWNVLTSNENEEALIEDLIIQLNLDKVNALFYLTNNPA